MGCLFNAVRKYAGAITGAIWEIIKNPVKGLGMAMKGLQTKFKTFFDTIRAVFTKDAQSGDTVKKSATGAPDMGGMDKKILMALEAFGEQEPLFKCFLPPIEAAIRRGSAMKQKLADMLFGTDMCADMFADTRACVGTSVNMCVDLTCA